MNSTLTILKLPLQAELCDVQNSSPQRPWEKSIYIGGENGKISVGWVGLHTITLKTELIISTFLKKGFKLALRRISSK